MLFSSISFLYYFLPLTIGLYFAVPKGFKNTVLFLASLVFYGWGEPKYVILMGLSVLLGYGFGLLVEKYRQKSAGRILCVASVGVSLSFLLYFKYSWIVPVRSASRFGSLRIFLLRILMR